MTPASILTPMGGHGRGALPAEDGGFSALLLPQPFALSEVTHTTVCVSPWPRCPWALLSPTPLLTLHLTVYATPSVGLHPLPSWAGASLLCPQPDDTPCQSCPCPPPPGLHQWAGVLRGAWGPVHPEAFPLETGQASVALFRADGPRREEATCGTTEPPARVAGQGSRGPGLPFPVPRSPRALLVAT